MYEDYIRIIIKEDSNTLDKTTKLMDVTWDRMLEPFKHALQGAGFILSEYGGFEYIEEDEVVVKAEDYQRLCKMEDEIGNTRHAGGV